MPKHLTTNDTSEFVTSAEVGAVSGVAALGSDGKVPSSQLPTAVANPVTSVNGVLPGPSGDVEIVADNLGALTTATADGRYVSQTSRGAANGVAALDGSGKVPGAQIPTLSTGQIPDLSGTYVATSRINAVSGVAGLDGSGLVPGAQIPDLSGTYVAASRINAASGVAGLDASSKLSGSQQLYSPTATVVAVGSVNAGGAANSAARGDHVHAGVTSFNGSQGALTVAATDLNGVSNAQYLDNMAAPGDQGLIAWSGDPAGAGVSASPASGGVRLMRIILRRAATLNTVWVVVATAGATLTSGQNFIGLYTSAGTRVALTADQTTAWGTTGIKSAAFTSSYAAAAGSYYVALLSVGTTTPLFAATSVQSSGLAANVNLSVSTGRSLNGPSAQTSLPTSITMASNTLGTSLYWVGVS